MQDLKRKIKCLTDEETDNLKDHLEAKGIGPDENDAVNIDALPPQDFAVPMEEVDSSLVNLEPTTIDNLKHKIESLTNDETCNLIDRLEAKGIVPDENDNLDMDALSPQDFAVLRDEVIISLAHCASPALVIPESASTEKPAKRRKLTQKLEQRQDTKQKEETTTDRVEATTEKLAKHKKELTHKPDQNQDTKHKDDMKTDASKKRFHRLLDRHGGDLGTLTVNFPSGPLLLIADSPSSFSSTRMTARHFKSSDGCPEFGLFPVDSGHEAADPSHITAKLQKNMVFVTPDGEKVKAALCKSTQRARTQGTMGSLTLQEKMKLQNTRRKALKIL